MVTDGRYAYAIGGRALSSDKNSAAVERYDPEADRWEALAPLPTPRGGFGAVVRRRPHRRRRRRGARRGDRPGRPVRHRGQHLVAAAEDEHAAPRARPRRRRHHRLRVRRGRPAEPRGVHRDQRVAGPPGAPARTRHGVARRRGRAGRPAVHRLRRRRRRGCGWSAGSPTTRPPPRSTPTTPRSTPWTLGPDLPIPLHHVTAVSYNGRAVGAGRLDPGRRQRVGSQLRPGVRAAQRPVGRDAEAAAPPRGRRGRRRRRQDRPVRRADQRPARPADRGLRRHEVDRRGADPDPARAPRRQLRRHVRLRDRRAGSCRRRRTWRRSSGSIPPPTRGRPMPPMPTAARRARGGLLRRPARRRRRRAAQRTCWAPSRPTTSTPACGPPSPRSPPRATAWRSR